MKSPGLEKFLNQHRKIGLDTNVFIYQVEENPKYIELTNQIFKWLEEFNSQGVTSTITMLKLLVQPYELSDIDLVNKFYALLSTYPNLEWVATTLEISDKAARLRAEHNLRTPDAIQAATARTASATGFISNDPIFKRIKDIEVIVLDQLLVDKKEVNNNNKS